MEVTIELLSVKTKDTDTQKDLITDTTWKLVVSKTVGDKVYSEFMEMTSGMFEDAPEKDYVQYDDLTDDQILEWSKAQFSDELFAEFIASLEASVESRIAIRPTRMKVKAS
jgi:hypothetical protein